jgi:ribosomal protein S27E
MAALGVRDFTKVVTTNPDLFKFRGLSSDLVAAYIKIAGASSARVIDIHCTEPGNVHKVFSHSIRAFLAWLGLEYDSHDPCESSSFKVDNFITVETTVNDLLKYKDQSKGVVDEYTKILNIPNPIVVDDTCNDLENVKKVFSHSARAFLALAKQGLEYNTGEPVNQ